MENRIFDEEFLDGCSLGIDGYRSGEVGLMDDWDAIEGEKKEAREENDIDYCRVEQSYGCRLMYGSL